MKSDEQKSNNFCLDTETGRLFLCHLLEDFETEIVTADYLDVTLDVIAVDMASGEKRKSAKSNFRLRVNGQNLHSPVRNSIFGLKQFKIACL